AAARAGQQGQTPEGLVARRERYRRRADADQRPLLGPCPDRGQHRAEAPAPADEARHRTFARERLRPRTGRCRGRGHARRSAALRRDGDPPRRSRGFQPLPGRAEAARAAERSLRGAGADGDCIRSAARDHESSRVREAAHARGRHRQGRRRTRHGEWTLAGTGYRPYDETEPWGAESEAPERLLAEGALAAWSEDDLANSDAPARVVDAAVDAVGPLTALVVVHTESRLGGILDTTAAV